MHIQVDSAEWFGWLATLVSFRFAGPAGRFMAYRNANQGRRTLSWIAHRYFHGRRFKTALGVTDRLTIVCLEQVAAQLHAHLTAY